MSSMSAIRSYGTPASASSTFMWPGMRPATGWIANFTLTPRFDQLLRQLPDLVLRLRDRHAVAGHDHHAFGVGHHRRDVARLDRLSARPDLLRLPPPPKLENSTLVIERFIALAIRRVSSVPAAPTIMPAMISAWLPST
jgi:hypothetical protein